MMKKFLLIFICLVCVLTVRSQVQIIGTVTSGDDKNPMPGVSVIEKGTNNGTSTQSDGSFSVNVSSNQAILVFYFVGYVIKEEPVNARNNLKVELEVNCIRDWFDSQRISLSFNSGLINNPIGGQFEFAFPAYFGSGTLTTGFSVQTDLNKNDFINAEIKLKHFIFDCNSDVDANGFYRQVDFKDDFHAKVFSIEPNFNLGGFGFIAGYSHLSFNKIETSDIKDYSGAIIGLRKWVKRLLIIGKVGIYNDKQEYFGQITRDSKYIDLSIKFYKLDSFNELSLGIGKTFGYRIKRK